MENEKENSGNQLASQLRYDSPQLRKKLLTSIEDLVKQALEDDKIDKRTASLLINTTARKSQRFVGDFTEQPETKIRSINNFGPKYTETLINLIKETGVEFNNKNPQDVNETLNNLNVGLRKLTSHKRDKSVADLPENFKNTQALNSLDELKQSTINGRKIEEVPSAPKKPNFSWVDYTSQRAEQNKTTEIV